MDTLDRKFVFPSENDDTTSTISVAKPPSCRGSTFCENDTHYPRNLVDLAIQQNSSLKLLTSVDVINSIHLISFFTKSKDRNWRGRHAKTTYLHLWHFYITKRNRRHLRTSQNSRNYYRNRNCNCSKRFSIRMVLFRQKRTRILLRTRVPDRDHK